MARLDGHQFVEQVVRAGFKAPSPHVLIVFEPEIDPQDLRHGKPDSRFVITSVDYEEDLAGAIVLRGRLLPPEGEVISEG
jgi:hypothetical protein